MSDQKQKYKLRLCEYHTLFQCKWGGVKMFLDIICACAPLKAAARAVGDVDCDAWDGVGSKTQFGPLF